jgi:D-sedoheptulose 7-phosphate isomerase
MSGVFTYYQEIFMHRFEEMLRKDRSPESFTAGYISHLSSLLIQLDTSSFARIIRLLDQERMEGQNIFLCGNGGSAATASHIAEDLALGPKKKGQKAFRTIGLTDNAACITAIGNDDGYEQIFVKQLENLFNKGDLVIGISASGNSPNVIKAMEYANMNGGISIGLTGFDGGMMKKICQYCLHVPTEPGEYEPVEDAHLIMGHILASYFKYQSPE